MVGKKDKRLEIKKVVLDAGHGSVDPVTGSDSEALTRKYIFPNGHVVYEGELNRLYTKEIKSRLEQHGITVVETAPDHKDTSLAKRVKVANRQDSSHTYFLSIHHNASASHKAHGFEGWTSKYSNRSDSVMECILKRVQEAGIKLRSDNSDGDLDREANYYVLRNNKNRAGLLEIDFYDHWESYLLVRDDEYIEKISRLVVRGILDYNEGL